MKILVAGVGNVLWGDDGFGVEVAHRLQAMEWPPSVKVVETGIGGIHLVQEIIAGYDALIVIDAVDHDRPPGTVMVIQPEVMDVHTMPDLEKYDYLADMHYTKPEKAFMLAKALNILPERFLMVGCQPLETGNFERGLTEPVARAVEVGVREVRRLIEELLQEEQEGVHG